MLRNYVNLRTFFNPENLLADENQLFPCLGRPSKGSVLQTWNLAGWDVVCWLHSQIRNQRRCYGRMVTIHMTVTIHLQPWLPYMKLGLKKFLMDRNLALKYHYWTGIWYRDLLGCNLTFDGVWHWRTDSCFHVLSKQSQYSEIPISPNPSP